jgi:PAS domain S-box-containing protein
MVEITGYSMEEINDLGWYQSVYPDPEVRERVRRRMERMRQGEDLRNERWEITRADGKRCVLRISTSVLTAKDGTVHVLGLMSDATEEEEYHRLLKTRIATLERLLPICASCKKIRDEEGRWHEPELYVSEHLHASFTHGICAECRRNLYPGRSD